MSIVIVGRLPEARAESIRSAVVRGGGKPITVPDPVFALKALADGEIPVPHALLVDCGSVPLGAFVGAVRAEARLFGVPIVATVARVSSQEFATAQEHGADDVTPAEDLGGLTRRVASLLELDPQYRTPITRGVALIAYSDEVRRRVVGRLLRQAGFDVRFAASVSELAWALRDTTDAQLVVSAAALEDGDVAACLRQHHEPLGDTAPPTIVLAPEPEAPELATLMSLPRLTLANERAPADHLLFLANELMRPPGANTRASKRLLYGTLCSVRPQGVLEPTYAVTYNISREGLFIRTLDTPQQGDIAWVELRAPAQALALHLRGEVVWRSKLNSGSLAPPGFGVRLNEAACPKADLDAYRAAYDAFVEGTYLPFGDTGP